MIALNRREAVQFRAAVRRCVAGRPRALAPPIVLQQSKDGLTLSVVLEETTLALRLSGTGGPPARLVIPFSVLASLEGPGGGIARFETKDNGSIGCCWEDHGETKELDYASVPGAAEPAVLPPVGKLQTVEGSLLPALHACGQTACRTTGGRLALARLQLRGQDGAIAGTDGHQLLLWGGFAFPFQENLLVPAMPIFGGRELARHQVIHLGKTETHVTVAAGPWTIWLAIDRASRYPDVMAVIPRTSRLAKLVIDDADAAALLQDLNRMPTASDEVVPVVLDLGSGPAVRWPEGTPDHRGPLNLIRSTSSGSAITIRMDPKYLVRALGLGFREVCCTSKESPVLFRDEHRCYLVAPFGAASAGATSLPNPQPLAASGSISTSPQQGEEPMNPENCLDPPTDQPPANDVLDPLTEAEALRVALAEVVRRVGRLILYLRQFQKQRRALQAAWTSLKHLRLGPQEEP